VVWLYRHTPPPAQAQPSTAAALRGAGAWGNTRYFESSGEPPAPLGIGFCSFSR
jgi:hypothetical protein